MTLISLVGFGFSIRAHPLQSPLGQEVPVYTGSRFRDDIACLGHTGDQ